MTYNIYLVYIQGRVYIYKVFNPSKKKIIKVEKF